MIGFDNTRAVAAAAHTCAAVSSQQRSTACSVNLFRLRKRCSEVSSLRLAYGTSQTLPWSTLKASMYLGRHNLYANRRYLN